MKINSLFINNVHNKIQNSKQQWKTLPFTLAFYRVYDSSPETDFYFYI